jgi:hypothetical protein
MSRKTREILLIQNNIALTFKVYPFGGDAKGEFD